MTISTFVVFIYVLFFVFFFFKQKTAYEMRISDWSSDVCSSDLDRRGRSGTRHLRCRGSEALCPAPGTEAAKRILGPRPLRRDTTPPEIGRASCRERVCQYV